MFTDFLTLTGLIEIAAAGLMLAAVSSVWAKRKLQAVRAVAPRRK